jgi:hypothetical protein
MAFVEESAVRVGLGILGVNGTRAISLFSAYTFWPEESWAS